MGCGFKERALGCKARFSVFPQRQVVKGTRRRGPQPLPALSRRPTLSGLGAPGRTRLLHPRPTYRLRPAKRGPHVPGLPALRPANRPRRALPVPPGKMAPAEQLRHQHWRRARPSAILAPSNRPLHPAPHNPRKSLRPGRSGGAKRVGPAHSQPKERATEPLVSSDRPRGARRRSPAGPPVLRAARGLVRARPRVVGGASDPGGEATGEGPGRPAPARAPGTRPERPAGPELSPPRPAAQAPGRRKPG